MMSPPVRIGLVHYTYLPTIGGVETVVAQHARLFADHGHEVTIFCNDGESDDPRIRLEPFLPALSQRTMEEQRIVFAHNVCTMPFDLGITGWMHRCAEDLPHVRFVCWTHDVAAANPDYHIPRGPRPMMLLRLWNMRMEYVAVSELRARQMVEFLRLPPERCRVIPNGIDPAATLGLTAPVAAFAERHRLLERDVVLFHPARLVRRKNVELGLRVCAALRDAGRDCAYVITAPPDAQNAASADYAASLAGLRAELALQDDALFVHEHFAATERDVASLYALADALFFPSRQEGFGLPLLEAALHRLPIFCADIEPLRSLLDQGVSLFPLNAAPEHIASQVMRQLDDSRAMQTRKAVAQRHAWPAIYRNFLAPLLAETNTSLRP